MKLMFNNFDFKIELDFNNLKPKGFLHLRNLELINPTLYFRDDVPRLGDGLTDDSISFR